MQSAHKTIHSTDTYLSLFTSAAIIVIHIPESPMTFLLGQPYRPWDFPFYGLLITSFFNYPNPSTNEKLRKVT